MFKTNKIKLMHVIYSLDTGGLEKLVLELVKRVDPAKFQSSVCCLTREGALSKELTGLGINIFYLDKKGGVGYSVPFKIARLLKKEKIDIVHTHDSSANLYGGMAAKIAGVKVILNTEHGGIYFETRRKRLFNRLLCLLNDKEICVSNSVKEDLLAMGLSSKRLSVIHNGIDIDKFNVNIDIDEKRKELGLHRSDFVIGTIGRISWEKNQKLMLDAANQILEKIPEVKFLFVGDGPLRPRLESYAESLKIKDKTIFLGHRDDIAGLLPVFDCFVNCSISESFGLTLVEAMIAGVPVIATDVGGVKEIVKNGETGILIKNDDIKGLVESISRIKNDLAFSKSMIFNAKESAKNNYDIKFMVKNYEDIYLDSYKRHCCSIISNGKRMNILTFGIDNRALEDVDGHSKRWNSRMGLYLDRLDVIVEVKEKSNIREKQIADNVRILPIYVPHPALYPFIAFRKAMSEHKKNSYDLITSEEPFRAGLASWLFKRKTGVSLSAEYHNDTFYNKEWLMERPVRHSFYKIIGKITLRGADSIRCVNHKNFLDLKEICNDKKKMIEIIPVPAEFYNFGKHSKKAIDIRKNIAKKADDIIILFVGRLIAVKKVDELINVFSELRTIYANIHLVIVGDGSEYARLHKMAENCGMERIIFKGYVLEEEVLSYYGASDIFINPSHSETYGRIYIEAMSAGKPVITTSGVGAVEGKLCINDVNSLIVEPGDLAELKSALIRLIENKDLRDKLGKNGLQTVKEKFNYEDSLRRVKEFWEETIKYAKKQ